MGVMTLLRHRRSHVLIATAVLAMAVVTVLVTQQYPDADTTAGTFDLVLTPE